MLPDIRGTTRPGRYFSCLGPHARGRNRLRRGLGRRVEINTDVFDLSILQHAVYTARPVDAALLITARFRFRK